MIPLRDSERAESWPKVVILLLAANGAIFAWQWQGGEEHLVESVDRYGLRPALATGFLRGESEVVLIDYEIGRRGNPVAVERSTRPTFQNALFPFLSSMFLHGGILHLLGNLWFLWIFADNVESRMSAVRFTLFYLLTGIAAGVIHVAFDPDSSIPCVGASGAISGVLGGYMVLFPRARVLALVPLGFFLQVMELPAKVFLLFWFGLQLFSAFVSTEGMGGVAWWAHIGGFVAGAALARPFARRR